LTAHHPGSPVKLSFAESMALLLPYLREKLLEQIRSIWFIVVYLLFFQVVVLGLPVIYGTMIAVGIATVALGLMLFMEGLRLGLMPLGETIGSVLPSRAGLALILLFAFLIGLGATYAEPAIAVLRSAGAGVAPDQAPLLYSLLNDFSGQLVICVGIGVGVAVALGVMRFFFNWSLKLLILPIVLGLCLLTLWTYSNDILNPIIGLAWDSGAVTTGPVTVPLVLALGIGVCRIVGSGDSSTAGFGIVTLASLFPILAVLLLGNYHYLAEDYYGAAHYSTSTTQALADNPGTASADIRITTGYSEAEFENYLATGTTPADATVRYTGGNIRLENGQIIIEDVRIELVKQESEVQPATDSGWDPQLDVVSSFYNALLAAFQAILPLCAFLYLTLRFVLGQKLQESKMVGIGVIFAVAGMMVFTLGLTMGLTPLGSQLGADIPSAFAEITPWGMIGQLGPLYGEGVGGKIVAILFGFFLGYGATMAEPALNALGDTVQKITVGAFKKSLLMQSVAIGVAIGIGAGVFKIAFNIPLVYMLVPPYLLLMVLTWISSEDFVNFGWDSAGVTTGPITVPLVLAMGLGIGARVPGVTDGFGILALASVGPILTVLSVGLMVARMQRKRDEGNGGQTE
jgi:hypothetical protein